MEYAVHWFCVAVLCALLVAAAIGDIRRLTIPNSLTSAVAALSLPYWLSAGMPFWPTLGGQVLLATVVLVLLAGLFAAGLMGGGDVKLLAALALWLPPAGFAALFAAVALLGGALTLGLLALQWLRGRDERPAIPYGVAIAGAALAAFGEPLVKHFPI